MDNIDHNPSATTAKDALHGTSLSLFQHPTCTGEEVDRGVVVSGGSMNSKAIQHLPHFYTDVPPATSMTSLKRNDFKKCTEGEKMAGACEKCP